MNFYIFVCPHCKGELIVDKKHLNCLIFRHGILKTNGQQINPHLNKQQCDLLFSTNKIWGCGKPFQLVIINKEYVPIICDYI